MPTEEIIGKYINLAVDIAVLEITDDLDFFLTVPVLLGVWASGSSEETAKQELRSVIREWIDLKNEDQDGDIPIIELVDVN